MTDVIIDNEAPPFDPDAGEAGSTTFLAVIGHDPKVVLSNPAKLKVLYADMEAKLKAFVPDLSTKASRKRIASHASKFTRTKTAIEEARKAANEEAQNQIKARNLIGKAIVERIQGMQDLARKPLDDWETAEEQRLKTIADTRSLLASRSLIQSGATAASIEAVIEEIEAMEFDAAVFLDDLEEIKKARRSTCLVLYDARDAAEKAAEEAAELENLRVEAAARRKIDEAAAEVKRKGLATIEYINEVGNGFIGGRPQPYGILFYELEEKIVVDASLGEYEALARNALEAARAKLKIMFDKEADDRRKKEADATAETARQAAEAERLKHEQELADANERARKAEQKLADDTAQAEREAEARKADIENTRKKIGEAKAALIEEVEIDEATASAVLRAIISGEIPHVSLTF